MSVGFDTRHGTGAATWRADPRWGRGTSLDLAAFDRVVVVGAHPDDESLGAGGLLAAAVAAGLEVDLVCATDGEGSHPSSPTHTPAELASRRRQEWSRAADELGISSSRRHRLGLADSDVAGHEQELTTALVDLVGDGRRTLVAATWRCDGHTDHEAVGRAAAAAVRRTGATLWEFPIWWWHNADPSHPAYDTLRTLRLDVGAADAKARAIAAHRSQVAPLSDQPGDEAMLTSALLEHFADGPEHFVVTEAADCPDDALDTLHAEDADPWEVDSSWYERRKRNLLISLLPWPRFRRGLEVGCSTGALAEALAGRCDRLVAIDRSPTAVAAAHRRLRHRPSVEVRLADVPREWPDGQPFDLVVISEVGYFLSPLELEALVASVRAGLADDGVVVLCHWRHPIEGWVLDAAAVHAAFTDPEAGLPPTRAAYRDRDVELLVLAHEWQGPDT